MYQEDYTQGYRESLEELKKTPGYIDMEELHWNVFSTEDGKKLIEAYKDSIAMRPVSAGHNGDFPSACVYAEGYRDALRAIITAVKSYQLKKDTIAKEELEKQNQG